jgi:hypothetical protein
MDISEIVFDEYIICPLCKKEMKSLSGTHLQRIHGFTGVHEFKLEYGIPMNAALIAHNIRAVMQKHGQRRVKWFRENVMPIGVELSKKGDLVPKELRKHSGIIRRGQSWIPGHISEMRSNGWLDLHDAAQALGIAYNYARKCATDGRLRVIISKGIRFTNPEWVEEARQLLKENRIKYHKPPRD